MSPSPTLSPNKSLLLRSASEPSFGEPQTPTSPAMAETIRERSRDEFGVASEAKKRNSLAANITNNLEAPSQQTVTSFNENHPIIKLKSNISEKLTINSHAAFQSHVPYIMAYDHRGKKMYYDFDKDIAQVTESDIEAMDSWQRRAGNLRFYAFFNNTSPPLRLGNIKDLYLKGFENDLFLNFLLSPVSLDIEEITRARALYITLFRSGLFEDPQGIYVQCLRTGLDSEEFKYHQEELLIDAASCKSNTLLRIPLNQKVNPNSFSSLHGVWAINVAKRHHLQNNVQMLRDFGADDEVKDAYPA